MYGYAIAESLVASFVASCSSAVAAQDIGRWQPFELAFTKLYPRLLVHSMGAGTNLGGPPLATASYYRADLRDLSVGVIPSWAEPTLQWLLMNAVLHTARHRVAITFEHFAFALDDKEFRTLAGEAAAPELELLLKTLLAQRRPPPASLACLETASYVHSFTTAEELQTLIALETDLSLLARTGTVLSRHEHFVSQHLGSDLLRLLFFIRSAALDRLAVFMTPYPLEG